MTTRISQQPSTLSGQSAAEALQRKEKSDKTLTSQPKTKLDASYELNLSETAQALMASPLPAVTGPVDAKKQFDLIRAAAEKSAASVLSSHKPNTKSVMDLLA